MCECWYNLESWKKAAIILGIGLSVGAVAVGVTVVIVLAATGNIKS